MNWNGLLVSTQAPGKHILSETNYAGVAYGTPWPLQYLPESVRSGEDVYLTETIDRLTLYGDFEENTYALAAVTDRDLTRRYVARCQNHGIPVRILLCQTPRRLPLLPDAAASVLARRAKFLGYDYTYSSFDFSALHDDLLPPQPTPRLREMALRLNSNGLFDAAADLDAYVEERWNYVLSVPERFEVRNGSSVRISPLEDTGDFVACMVYYLHSL